MRSVPRAPRWGACAVVVAIAACAPEVDPLCEDAPTVTWETFGQGLLVEDCQPCHASTAPDRHGAPDEVIFDTHADAIRWRDDILRVATGDTPSMPPALDLGEASRVRLALWLTCYEE